MIDATTQSSLRAPAGFQSRDQGEGEIVAIVRTAVGQLGLGLTPHALIGVEFRRVGRKGFQMEPGVAVTQGLHGRAAMRAQPVPDHDHTSVQMTQQVTQERAHLGPTDVVVMPLVVKPETLTHRTDREARDDRDSVTAIPVSQQRCLTARRPGPHHRGQQHEAGFIYEDEVGPQPYGVFFTRGQALRFQRAIAASSRSLARRSGFWQLQPHWARSRPT